jgi:hypothetical protein
MLKLIVLKCVILLLVIIGLGSPTLAQGESVKTSVPGNAVVIDLAADLINLNSFREGPERRSI